jgi:hypothetical protein
MVRRPCTFRLTDLTRALKGARAAGVEVARFEIDTDGRIVVVTTESADIGDERNDLDKWIASRADQT